MPIAIGAATLFVAVLLLGLGNTVGYHRLLTHRSFKSGPGVRTAFTLLGAMHSGAPMTWVGLHRLHHAKSDSDEDPHTPTKGFWYGHSGWLVGSNNPVIAVLFAVSGFGQQGMLFWHDLTRVLGKNPPVWRQMCPDLRDERLMRILDVPFVTFGLFAAQLAAAWLIGGWWGIAWLWAVHLFLTNASWAVNSVCHWPSFGHQTFPTREQSRNVPWMTWVTNGEGWHNNHHRYPRSAWHALGEGPDLSWSVIQGLERAGLAWDLWLPKRFREAA